MHCVVGNFTSPPPFDADVCRRQQLNIPIEQASEKILLYMIKSYFLFALSFGCAVAAYSNDITTTQVSENPSGIERLYCSRADGEYTIKINLDYDHDEYWPDRWVLVPENLEQSVSWGHVENDLFELHVPAGSYSFALMFNDNSAVACSFDAAEGVTVAPDFTKAVNKYTFNPLLPDGTEITGSLKDMSMQTIEKGSLTAAMMTFGVVVKGRYCNLYSQLSELLRLDYGSMVYDPCRETAIYVDDSGLLIPYFKVEGVSAKYGVVSVGINADGMEPGVISNDVADYREIIRKWGNTLWVGAADNEKYPDADMTQVGLKRISSTWIPRAEGASIVDGRANIFGDKEWAAVLDKVWVCGKSIDEGASLAMCPAAAKGIWAGDNDAYGILSPCAAPAREGVYNIANHANGMGEGTFSVYDNWPAIVFTAGNPVLSYPNAGVEDIVYGGNTPTLFYMPGDMSRFDFRFLGRYGEIRSIDNMNMTMQLKFAGDVIANDYGELRKWWADPTGEGVYELTAHNSNLTVDGMPASLDCEMKWDTSRGRGVCPTLQVVRFSENGVPTDRMTDPAKSTITIYGGSYWLESPENGDEWYDFEAANVAVEYAPYGSEDFAQLPVEVKADKFYMPGYGACYEGTLDAVSRESGNGWYDLRVTFADENGNIQRQTISPAFRLDTFNSIGDLQENIVGDVTVVGNCVVAPEGTRIYTPAGIPMGFENLAPGIYVVVTPIQTVKVAIR